MNLLSIGILLVLPIQKPLAQSTIIDSHFKALNSHDIKAITSGYSADAQIVSPNWEGAKTGTDSISVIYNRYFKSTPDLKYVVTNVINAGNVFTVEYTWSGSLSNPEGGEPAYMKGKAYKLKACAIFVVKGNKIVKETDYFDQVAFLRQVGFFDQH